MADPSIVPVKSNLTGDQRAAKIDTTPGSLSSPVVASHMLLPNGPERRPESRNPTAMMTTKEQANPETTTPGPLLAQSLASISASTRSELPARSERSHPRTSAWNPVSRRPRPRRSFLSALQLPFGFDPGCVDVTNRLSDVIKKTAHHFLLFRILQGAFPERDDSLRVAEKLLIHNLTDALDTASHEFAYHVFLLNKKFCALQVLERAPTDFAYLKAMAHQVVIDRYFFFINGQGQPINSDTALRDAGERAAQALLPESFLRDGTSFNVGTKQLHSHWSHPVIPGVIKAIYFENSAGYIFAIAANPDASILQSRITDEALALVATLIYRNLEEIVNDATNRHHPAFTTYNYAPIYDSLLRSIRATHDDPIHGARLKNAQLEWARAGRALLDTADDDVNAVAIDFGSL
ncbi:hypothetical protein BDN72DRAFT_902860 [Pluteus cervinus]|uniref:Uncharacterized protein n=1 Tax=Pluteus cervinus TaxID=181527 RepID=A0ACD3AB35_9AGAR|nr:hypothetical protein BDN72DRAFT_902860 [Pluteus cervinus]